MATEIDVSMLWEAADARSELATQFGFTDVNHAVSWLERALAEAWSGHLDRCDRLVMSDRNLLAWLTVDGREVVAKWPNVGDPARGAVEIPPSM